MSNKVLRIIISEEPIPKGRSRIVFINGKVRSYTPQHTQQAQDSIVVRLKRHQDNAFPAGMPLKLTAVFFRTKSKYLPNKEILPFRKPDLDNLLKLLMDASNGLLFSDDAQLTNISVKKRWTNRDTGYITLRLEEDSL
jgi:Holliday junction resolvase RusA-like endonuclease